MLKWIEEGGGGGGKGKGKGRRGEKRGGRGAGVLLGKAKSWERRADMAEGQTAGEEPGALFGCRECRESLWGADPSGKEMGWS